MNEQEIQYFKDRPVQVLTEQEKYNVTGYVGPSELGDSYIKVSPIPKDHPIKKKFITISMPVQLLKSMVIGYLEIIETDEGTETRNTSKEA